MSDKPIKPITFTIDSNILADAIAKVGTAIGTNPLIPILEDVRIVLTGDMCSMHATDLAMWRSESFSLLSGVTADFTLPYKMLRDFLAALRTQQITFSIEQQDKALNCTIKHSKGKIQMPANPGQDFPVIEFDTTESQSFTVKGNDLAAAMSHTNWAIGTGSDPRPFLTSHLLSLVPGKMIVYTTGGHEMAAIGLGCNHSTQADILAPKTVHRAMVPFLKGKDEVTCIFSKSKMSFTDKSSTFGFTLPESPMTASHYLTLVPSDPGIVFDVDAVELISALKRMQVGSMEADTGKYGAMQVMNNQIVLVGSQKIYNTAAEETITITPVTLEPEIIFEIGINYTKFMAGLIAAGGISEDIRIKIKAVDKAIIFHPVGREDAWCLTMPVSKYI